MVNMKEKLSALMDEACAGEELGAVLARLKDDPELRGTWADYHLVGDALRGHVGPDLTARVGRRLAEEPTVLAPRSRHRPARMAWYATSAAASLAALALVIWTALPLMQQQPQVADGAGANAPIVPIAATPAPAAEPKARAATAEVEDYLLAHQPYSHTSAMQGVAPYVRTVAEGNRSNGDGGNP